MATKTDARTSDSATQVHLRYSVVKAVRGGMKQAHAAKTFGVSVRAANKWTHWTRRVYASAIALQGDHPIVAGVRVPMPSNPSDRDFLAFRIIGDRLFADGMQPRQ